MKKKSTQFRWLITMLLLVTAMAMPKMAWAEITPTQPSIGDGTSANPYQIGTAAELYWFAALVNGTNGLTQNFAANAILTQNITINQNVLLDNGEFNSESESSFEKWTPIGYLSGIWFAYTGTFDGQGHTISGLYFNDSNTGNVGLFGVNGGTIMNVGVADSYFYGKYDVGGVCGYNVGTITGCYNTGTVSGNNSVGGVCGGNSEGTITGCYNTGTVSGNGFYVGGVCGDNEGTITSCYNTGTVSGTKFVGGVCGGNYDTITGCYNTGTVSGNYQVGGVCGGNYDTITGCYNMGTVSGNNQVGGVCGDNERGTITGCYNTGTVSGNYQVGGVCGGNSEGTITGCYNTGTVSGNNDVGGVCGYNVGTITGCYNTGTGTVSVNNTDVGGVCGRNDDTITGCYTNNGRVCGLDYGTITDCEKMSNDNFTNGTVCPLLNDALKNANASVRFYQGTNYPELIMNVPSLVDGVYQISNKEELYAFALLVNKGETSANAVLTANITVNTGVLNENGTLNNNDSGFETWTPIIGNDQNPFTGTFDGKGHTISGLYFNDSNAEYVGLFGKNSGTIKNVGVVDSYFMGYYYVGGVCGDNGGTITGCYNTGTVSGTKYVGGVCGENGGIITGCYNTGTFSGNGNYVGGVCGINGNDGTITGCYNTGTVSGNGFYVGGVCGDNRCIITGCYTNNGGVYGYNLGTITDCYEKSDDDFTNGTVCSLLNTALQNTNASVRFYQGENYPEIINLPSLVEDVYQISNKEELYAFALLINNVETSANAVLTANITVNTGVLKEDGTLADDVSEFETWTPIGNNQNPYTGTFDGQGHTISGLYFNDVDASYVGLFGGNCGTIKNVGVVDSYFYGNDYVGGVCGKNNSGKITGCFNTSTVSSNNLFVGGVCGANSGIITGCYNTGTVIGNGDFVGGVCGHNSYGTITDCYYLSGTATGGIDSKDVAGSAEAKTTTQFASGEVCYLLNGSRSEGTEENPLAWYQNISSDSRDTYPVLTATGTNTVYQVKNLCGGTVNAGKTYSNTNKDITVEHILSEPADFNSDKKIYSNICQREGCGKTLYYADAAGTIEATLNAEETAFAVASYTLADATAYNSEAEFTVTSLAYKRTFYDDKWMAVYVPFAIDCSKLDTDYEMATINNFHEYEQEDGTYNVVLEVKRVTKGGTISALTPCLIRMKTAPEAEVEKTLTFENAAFSAAADKSIDCSSVTRYYQFFGTLNGKTGLTADTDFVLNAGKLYKTSENTELLPQRWYLSATDRTSTPVEPATMLRSISINVIGDGEATGIEDIHVNTESGADASGSTGIYDLQGRKINSEPTKGMYIKNGKKYIK